MARDGLAAFVKGKRVTVWCREIDRYGRIVATLTTDSGDDVGEWMLRSGLAWWEYRFAPHVVKYRALQKQARKEGLGIWALKPWGFAPWVWRVRHHMGFWVN